MDSTTQFRVACLGDSHTRCIYGYDWVGQLNEELGAEGVVLGRFGINGELAYHATQRLQPVCEFRPDLVVVLLGSNDVNAISSEKFTRLYMGKGDLPQVPDKGFFLENMNRIVERIRESTTASVALVTIPLLGEVLESSQNILVDEYNRCIAELCRERGLRLIDFNAAMKQALKSNPSKKRRGHYDGKVLMRISLLRHRLLFHGWDRVGKANGLYLLTDTIHLNERSGRILAGLVKDCVLKQVS